ncbi:hypothetical protein F5887DRAFT_933719 [Amanita rubescens]|nr:hypothetical protein F5887DRAFT_933719 [Amanita rubescens]
MSSSDYHHVANGDQPQDDLAAYFNKSASAVQCYVDHFEHDVVKPAVANSHIFFKERPITATLAAIFSILSFLPVLAFVSASLFSIATIVLVVVVTLLSFLLLALFVNLFIALSFTGLLTFAYIILRLAILVRERGTDGFSDWAAEGFVLINGGPPHSVGEVVLDGAKPVTYAQDEKVRE